MAAEFKGGRQPHHKATRYTVVVHNYLQCKAVSLNCRTMLSAATVEVMHATGDEVP